MSVRKRDSEYHTYGDYLVWSRSFGDELIDGTAYVREPPSASVPHQVIVGEIYHQLAIALEKTPWRVFVAPLDVRIPASTEPDEDVATVVQPDVLIVRDIKKLDLCGLRGAPDWLTEVLSPSTAAYDRRVKIPVYERAGVREVWLIHPGNLTVTIYRLEQGRYAPPIELELKGQTEIAAVPGVKINWAPVVARVLEIDCGTA
jgi:Uma2 family endonuclease